LAEAADLDAIPGYGIRARIGEQQIAVGARRFMDRLSVSVTAAAAAADRLAEDGKTPIYVAADN
jgi:Cu+-exporting ATPase